MLVGIPVVLVLLPLSWILLTKITFKVPSSFLGTGLSSGSGETEDLGPMSRQEYLVASVMVIVAVLWLTRPLLADLLPGLPLSDAGIAMIGALSLFILPDRWSAGRFLLEWDDIKSLRWDVLILFGGGLSLAGAIASTGLADWIGRRE